MVELLQYTEMSEHITNTSENLISILDNIKTCSLRIFAMICWV